VLPDGCIDVVWDQADGISLVGPNRQAFLVPVGAGRRIGARLRPGGAPALLAVGAEGVLDARLDLSEVLGDAGRRLGAALDRTADPVASLHAWLAARTGLAELPDPVVVRAVRRLDDGCDRVGALAAEVGLSERALRRRVTAAVGYGPKRLGRVLRLWRALRVIEEGEELAGAAFLAGYADQAHFSHDCRELAGVSPSVLGAGDSARPERGSSAFPPLASPG
jgi:AraC-like DNA-binding protein